MLLSKEPEPRMDLGPTLAAMLPAGGDRNLIVDIVHAALDQRVRYT